MHEGRRTDAVEEGGRQAGTAGGGRGTEPPAAALLALQRSAGNAAVARAVRAGSALPGVLHRDPDPTAGAPATTAGDGTGPAAAHPHVAQGMRDSDDVELLQLKLNWHLGHLGLTLLFVDGWFGRKTAAAVRDVKRANGEARPTATVDEAFWTLVDARPTARGGNTGATTGGPAPEYDRMAADGLIDITLAIGFDEGASARTAEIREIQRGLLEVRGFREDAARGAALRAAARPQGAAAQAPGGAEGTRWLVQENVGTTADGHPVHVLVRLIVPPSEAGRGAGPRAAALAGMNESDTFMYGGHARYGTGPDFDRNFSFVIHWDRHPSPPRGATGREEVQTLAELEERLPLRGPEARKIAEFDRLVAAGALELVAHAAGNIGINEGLGASGRHHHTLSAHVMGLAAAHNERPLASSVTESRYRLWLFNACTSRDYVDAIRASAPANPNLGTAGLDMHASEQPTYTRASAESLLSYLDGVLARETSAALTARLEAAQRTIGPVPWGTSGFEDNPAPGP